MKRPDYEPGSVPDLMWALHDIERRAQQTLDSIRRGTGINGTSQLTQIRNEAKDARRHAVEYAEKNGAAS